MVRILRTLSGSRFDPKLVELFVEWFQDVFLETLVNDLWMEDLAEPTPCPPFAVGNPDACITHDPHDPTEKELFSGPLRDARIYLLRMKKKGDV